MEDNILLSVKKLLGLPDEYHQFDADIILHINTVFVILCQMGVGPVSGYTILDDTSLWSSYFGGNSNLDLIKSYMYLKVRMLFDPPASSVVAQSFNEQIKELEWRISVQVDPGQNN